MAGWAESNTIGGNFLKSPQTGGIMTIVLNSKTNQIKHQLGSGYSTAVEHSLHDPMVADLNPAERNGFSPQLSFLGFLSKGMHTWQKQAQ